MKSWKVGKLFDKFFLSEFKLLELWKDADEEISDHRDTINRLADLKRAEYLIHR